MTGTIKKLMEERIKISDSFDKRIADLKKELEEEIKKIIDSDGEKNVSIGADDPYDSGCSPVDIYKVVKVGVRIRDYIDVIPFQDLQLEVLSCILEEISYSENK